MLPNGVIFQAAPGTMEFTKKRNPQIGDIVTFKHRGFMLGSKKPKWPTLSHVRPEMSWENVVSNFTDKKPKRRDSGIHIPTRTCVPRGYWKKRENRRNRLCEFAAKMGFDPLVVENWENLKWEKLPYVINSMSYHLSRSYKRVIMDSFPELCFSKEWLQGMKEKARRHCAEN